MPRRLVFLCLQVGLALLLTEAALHGLRRYHDGFHKLLFLPGTPIDYERFDTLPELIDSSILGFRPNTPHLGFVLNSRSLRTPEYEIAKPEGVYRVVVLGDSFAYSSGGIPYGWHWPVLLGRQLEARRSQAVEVVNLGIPATGPAFQRRMWQLEGSRLEPDLVLLTFYVGNDFRDDVGDNALEGAEPGLVDRLARVSLTVRAFRALHRLRGLEPGALPGPSRSPEEPLESGGYELVSYRREYDGTRPSVGADFYARVVARRMEICLLARSDTFERQLDRVVETLESLAAEVDSVGARFVVVIVPDEFQVDAELRRAAFECAGTAAGAYDLERPQRALSRRLAAAGIETVDLLPAFRRVSDSRPLYRPRDTHWNPAGARLVARTLTAALEPPVGVEPGSG